MAYGKTAYCPPCGYTGTFNLIGGQWVHVPATGTCGATGFECGAL